MDYLDFYLIAEHGNENWKGNFTPREIANNATIKAAFKSLIRENTRENHLRTINQIIGYLRCMCDLKIISHTTFNDCIFDLRYMKSMNRE